MNSYSAQINSKYVQLNSLNVVNSNLLLHSFYENAGVIREPEILEINNTKFLNSSINSDAKKIFVDKCNFSESSLLISPKGTGNFSNFKVIDTKFIGTKSMLMANGNGLIKDCLFENCNEALKFNLYQDFKTELQVLNSNFKKNRVSISVSIPKSQNLLITNCELNENVTGINFQNSGNIKIKDCEILNSGSSGINLENYSTADILNTKIINSKLNGLNISNSGLVNIDNLEVTGCLGSGLRLINGSLAKISNSIFQNNGTLNLTNNYELSGIELNIGSNANTEIKNCTIQNNKNSS